MKGFDEMEGVDVFRLEGFEKGELIDWYVANGYVLVDEVLSAAECDEIVADLKKINRGDYGCEPIAAVDWSAGADRLLGRYMYIGEPHAYSSVIRRYITHPGVCRVLDCVVGAYVPFWDGGYKCVQTMFVTKGPGGEWQPLASGRAADSDARSLVDRGVDRAGGYDQGQWLFVDFAGES